MQGTCTPYWNRAWWMEFEQIEQDELQKKKNKTTLSKMKNKYPFNWRWAWVAKASLLKSTNAQFLTLFKSNIMSVKINTKPNKISRWILNSNKGKCLVNLNPLPIPHNKKVKEKWVMKRIHKRTKGKTQLSKGKWLLDIILLLSAKRLMSQRSIFVFQYPRSQGLALLILFTQKTDK